MNTPPATSRPRPDIPKASPREDSTRTVLSSSALCSSRCKLHHHVDPPPRRTPSRPPPPPPAGAPSPRPARRERRGQVGVAVAGRLTAARSPVGRRTRGSSLSRCSSSLLSASGCPSSARGTSWRKPRVGNRQDELYSGWSLTLSCLGGVIVNAVLSRRRSWRRWSQCGFYIQRRRD